VEHWLARQSLASPLMPSFLDLSSAPFSQARQTSPVLESAIIALRNSLAAGSDLGFVGAEAIAFELATSHPGVGLPCVRTIARILARNGLLDARRRVRRPAPPTGWYLPAVARGEASADAFDGIEDLPMEGVGLFHVLTSKSLIGPCVQAWIHTSITSAWTVQRLDEHWRKIGLPDYAQFDNDTRFQGPHNRPNVIGEVIRFCLRHGVTPVFAPPRETGFQADIEGFNALWQKKVWQRTHHASCAAAQSLSDKFCAAYTRRRAAQQDLSPKRRPFPAKSVAAKLTSGTIVFIRRTSETGTVRVLEQTYLADPQWPHRLVRVEVNVATLALRIFRLRRKAPERQPLIKQLNLKGPFRRE
jgi:hypothetical protein